VGLPRFHGQRVRDNLGSLGFKMVWALVVKTGVESCAVVEGFDVIKDGGTSLGKGGEAVVVNYFVFETAPEGLNEGIVVAIAFAAHGGNQAVLRQHLAESRAGKLGAAIERSKKGLIFTLHICS
jgi:hypothetical protein